MSVYTYYIHKYKNMSKAIYRKSWKQHYATQQNQPELSNQGDNDQSPALSQPKLHRINSTKNSHQMQKFVMPNAARVSYGKALRQQKIRKLQTQKLLLMESLEILKNGAVNCILEKDQTIAKLKSILSNDPPQKQTAKVQQIDNLLQFIKEVQQQRNFLRNQLQSRTRQFQRDINQKDRIIDEIYEQLNRSIATIDNLQIKDKLLEQNIKVMRADNQNLSVLLNQSQQSLREKSKQQIKYESQYENSQSSDNMLMINSSQISQIFPVDLSNSRNRCSSSSLIHSIQQKIHECHIKQLQQKHQYQILDLTNYYESKIEKLKQYRQLEEEKTPYFGAEARRNHQRISQNISQNSESSMNRQYRQRQRQRQKTLKKNLSLGSFHSQRSLMHTIDQRQQLFSPRRSLKQQICLDDGTSNKGLFILQHKFSRNSIHSSSDNNNQQHQQQQYQQQYNLPQGQQQQQPSINSDSQSIKKTSNNKHNFKYYELPRHKNKMFKKKKQNDISDKWEKVVWFTLGTLAGGSILTFGYKIFK